MIVGWMRQTKYETDNEFGPQLFYARGPRLVLINVQQYNLFNLCVLVVIVHFYPGQEAVST